MVITRILVSENDFKCIFLWRVLEVNEPLVSVKTGCDSTAVVSLKKIKADRSRKTTISIGLR